MKNCNKILDAFKDVSGQENKKAHKASKEAFAEMPNKEMQFVKGKLYTYRSNVIAPNIRHHLLIYPSALLAKKAFDSEKAGMTKGAPTHARSLNGVSGGVIASEYWSEKLGYKVRYSNPEDYFLYLGDKIFHKAMSGMPCRTLNFLVSDFSGWVIYTDDCKFEQST